MADIETPGGVDFRALFKRMFELCQPDFRKYYRVGRKGRIEATYASDGKYWADVQPLRNDESVDEAEPVIPKVEIPIIWGGPRRGLVCPPAVGTHCVLSYFDGDPSYPYISHLRWHGFDAPACEPEEFIIQLEPGVSIKIDKAKKILTLTPESVETEAGKDWTIIAAGQATIQAPQINLVGNITSTGAGGEVGTSEEKSDKTHEGSYVLNGDMTINGNLTTSGNSHAGTRSGGGV